MKQLNESLQHLDFENQLLTTMGIDKYASSIGNDEDFITVNFTVRSKPGADDLVNWLERGYDWIVDAETSPGEVTDGKFLVFAELNRRTNAAKRIYEIMADLETLTGLDAEEWKLNIGDSMYPASEETIKKHIPLSPLEYKEQHETELNEMRVIAGLEEVTIYNGKKDAAIQAMQRSAGII
jgi:hypothetical protein